MVATTLVIGAVVALLTGILYVYVGRRIWLRRVAGEAQLAADLFAVWWFALAGSTLIAAIDLALAAFDRLSLPLFVATTQLNLFLIVLALWGLLYYLIYLYTGKRAAIVPLTLFYIGYYFALAYFVISHEPQGVDVALWRVGIDYATPLEESRFLVVLLLLLVLPQILGAFLYFLLYFRVDTTTQRYRIALVSWSIIVWFSSALAASLLGLSRIEWWPLVSRMIGLAAALVILMAYVPPRWIRDRYGIQALPATPAREVGHG